MDTKPKISVIVPIYKVEAYLRQCLDTIVGQTYKNLEIILVDDGSPDGCPVICDEYAARDNRIKVIHQKNGGLSAARNAGLDVATGEYIAFVDSDDWVNTEMYERLNDVATSTNADIVTCGIVCCNGIDQKGTSANDYHIIKWKRDKALGYLPNPTYNIRFEVWNKLFKRSVIKKTRFKVGQIYEDVYFDRNVFFEASRIVTLNADLYYYRESRPGNINSSFKDNQLQIFKEINDFIEELNKLSLHNAAYLYLCYAIGTCISFYMSATRCAASNEHVCKIKKIYEGLYSQLRLSTLIKRPQYILFRVSPSLYLNIRKLFR